MAPVLNSAIVALGMATEVAPPMGKGSGTALSIRLPCWMNIVPIIP